MKPALQRQSLSPFRRVLTFKQWCEANAFSEKTGARILKSGTGPRVVQLSERRIGIRLSDNDAWLESRVR
jgi:predicted DNA-binding transcriptional regulator AlpA